jgi:L-threonylcarbamoyladenylate synthase
MVIEKNDPKLFPLLLKILKNKGIGILPCDTIYGIVGVAPATKAKIGKIKGRSLQKSFLELIPSIDWLKEYTLQTLPHEFVPYWPGPLTLIFKGKKGKEKVALRIPEDEILIDLLLSLQLPLYSTSVNFSGQDYLWKIADIIRIFEKKVDIIVDGGDLPDLSPSTIVDITVTPYKLVRQGALKLPQRLFS